MIQTVGDSFNPASRHEILPKAIRTGHIVSVGCGVIRGKGVEVEGFRGFDLSSWVALVLTGRDGVQAGPGRTSCGHGQGAA